MNRQTIDYIIRLKICPERWVLYVKMLEILGKGLNGYRNGRVDHRDPHRGRVLEFVQQRGHLALEGLDGAVAPLLQRHPRVEVDVLHPIRLLNDLVLPAPGLPAHTKGRLEPGEPEHLGSGQGRVPDRRLEHGGTYIGVSQQGAGVVAKLDAGDGV